MRISSENTPMFKLQVLIWLIAFGLNFISNLQYDPPGKAVAFAILTMFCYASIVYGNGSWLILQLYRRRKYVAYIFMAALLLVSTILLRSLAAIAINWLFHSPNGTRFTSGLLLYGIFSGIWIFIFSIFYRLAMDYFSLSRLQQEIATGKARTELHLLEQQVHPHFLFSTLNNIYYEARKGSPEVVYLIERLSAIMHYFTEESNKDEVPLREEVEFLESYIELECIRMRFEMPVEFHADVGSGSVLVPPLLLLPVVENIFKHGVDKRSSENFAEISLTLAGGTLVFTTCNRCLTPKSSTARGGTGLNNLRQRLRLYFDDRYKLNAVACGYVYVTTLQIPVHAN
jgi:sensor histidine kinase YesM